MWSVPASDVEKKSLEKKKISELIQKLDQEILNQNDIEKIQKFNEIYVKINKTLQLSKNLDSAQMMSLAIEILEKLFNSPISNISIEKLKCYSDILIIYSNNHSLLPSFITDWLFQNEPHMFKHHLISVFLRRNLLHLKNFD